MQTHSELMSIYPWGETTPYDQRTSTCPTRPASPAARCSSPSGGRRRRTTPRRTTGPPPLAAAGGRPARAPAPPFAGRRTRRWSATPPVPARIPRPRSPTGCDDTEYGKGKGGELTYKLKLPRSGRTRCGSGSPAPRTAPAGRAASSRACSTAPARHCARRSASARRCSGTRSSSCRAIRCSRAASTGASRTSPTRCRRRATSRSARSTRARTTRPPKGTLDRARFVGAGFPDYPWLFATDGEFTAFASVALGQFEPIKEHLRALRRASLITNGESGKVVHEVITDGSVYFGANADAGNTDETAKFPSAVALLWRWTGDNAFRDEMYAFAKSNLEYIYRELDDDKDGWPEGLGNVEREGMGPEKLDNTTATMRGLRDLEDLAKSKGDSATATWAGERAADLEARFETEWWMPEIPQHADSLGAANQKIQQRHWIGVTPMEIETVRDGRVEPGLTTRANGNAALNLRETSCYGDGSGCSTPARRAATLPSPTGPPSAAPSRSTRRSWPSARATTAGSARASSSASRPRTAACSCRPSTSSPARCRRSRRRPELLAPRLDRPQVHRAGDGAAGVGRLRHRIARRAPAARRAARCRPRLPRSRAAGVLGDHPGIGGTAIRLGQSGKATVRASRWGNTYTTRVQVGAADREAQWAHATRPARRSRRLCSMGRWSRRSPGMTNRGVEVTVNTGAGTHTLVVTTR